MQLSHSGHRAIGTRPPKRTPVLFATNRLLLDSLMPRHYARVVGLADRPRTTEMPGRSICAPFEAEPCAVDRWIERSQIETWTRCLDCLICRRVELEQLPQPRIHGRIQVNVGVWLECCLVQNRNIFLGFHH